MNPTTTRYPKKIPAGQRLKDLILNVDFAPTLAEYTGVKMDEVQRRSFTSGTENFNFTPAWNFYDLQKDLQENHNMYNDPQYAPVIKQMKKELLRLREEASDTDKEYPEMQELIKEYFD